MADEGAGLAGVEVETEPHGRQQGKQLAHHEVHLQHRGEGEEGYRRTGSANQRVNRWLSTEFTCSRYRGRGEEGYWRTGSANQRVSRWLSTEFTCSRYRGRGRRVTGRRVGLSGGDRRHNAGWAGSR